jgi:hypothetical protein
VRPSLRALLAALVLGLLASPAAAQLQLALVSGTILHFGAPRTASLTLLLAF